jgi:hypothetical protein
MNKKNKDIMMPSNCPLCGDNVRVTRFECTGCGSQVQGVFSTEGVFSLPLEYQKFIVVFLAHRGNLTSIEKELGISYPTINKMLDTINQMLHQAEAKMPVQSKLSRKEILDAIDKGQMSVKEATNLLENEE